ncbi:MAG: CRISPR-associated endonuclease Cas2 [Thermoplasmataceae archaeon]
MWIILTYDINEKRVNMIRKICRPYLKWVQNSVFLGDISWVDFKILQEKLLSKIVYEEDSILIFIARDSKLFRKVSIGSSKEFSNII